jgi:hypothetical protein
MAGRLRQPLGGLRKRQRYLLRLEILLLQQLALRQKLVGRLQVLLGELINIQSRLRLTQQRGTVLLAWQMMLVLERQF